MQNMNEVRVDQQVKIMIESECCTLAYAYALLPIRTEHITDSFQMT